MEFGTALALTKMLSSVLFTVTLFGVALCRTLTVTPFGNFSNEPLSEQDRQFIRRLPAHRGSYPPGFKENFLAPDGTIVHGTRPAGSYIKVIGSPNTTQAAIDRAAELVRQMLRLSPSHIFTNLSGNGAGVGVYTAAEKLTIFPEYANLRDTPQCHGRCDGSCAQTCTFDGRKWETVGGIGGIMALVLQENVLCYSSDPYRHRDNIAVHEFAHVIDGYGIDETERQWNALAYKNARKLGVWRPDAYSMSNSHEYFAEATGVFFYVNLQASPGGMNECSGQGSYCISEMAARYHIQQQDKLLYRLLVRVYTNGRGTEPGRLTICPQHTV